MQTIEKCHEVYTK